MWKWQNKLNEFAITYVVHGEALVPLVIYAKAPKQTYQ